MLLEVKNLSYFIKKKKILNEISFNVSKGNFITIIGGNGAGKTSLLKCLNNIIKHRSGEILWQNKLLENYDVKSLAQLLSYVPQADGRQLPFTVKEFLFMSRYPHSSPFESIKEEDMKCVDDALYQLGIKDFALRKIDSLSGGEKQKVLIAAALAQNTEVILLDEPVTFLDPKHQVEIYSILKKLNQQYNKTLITVSHDLNSIEESHHIIALSNGNLVFDGMAENLLESDNLESIYQTKFELIPRSGNNIPFIIPKSL